MPDVKAPTLRDCIIAWVMDKNYSWKGYKSAGQDVIKVNNKCELVVREGNILIWHVRGQFKPIKLEPADPSFFEELDAIIRS